MVKCTFEKHHRQFGRYSMMRAFRPLDGDNNDYLKSSLLCQKLQAPSPHPTAAENMTILLVTSNVSQ